MTLSHQKRNKGFSICVLIIALTVTIGVGRDYLLRQIQTALLEEGLIKAGAAPLLVDDFEKGLPTGIYYRRNNSIGGYQGTWARRPSYTIISKTEEEGRQGKFLVIDYKKEAGWAGWYTLLNGADISDYNTLTFWVKGDKGEEKFDTGLADQRMQDLQIDAVYAGPVDIFLPLGVTIEWQKVRVPLARVQTDLDMNNMGSVVLWFKYGGAGRIYIDDMQFEFDPEIDKMQEYNIPQAEFDPRHPRSLWVWKIDPINNLKARKELFKLCKNAAITNIYLYFGDFNPETEPEYADRLAQFLKEAHQNGLVIEALTGTPVWSLGEYHKDCLGWIDAFLRYNKNRPDDMRIDGISLDVEPYLTSEWNTARETIKKDYLELLGKVRKLLDNYGQGMRMGVAIPLFYTEIDNGRFETQVLQLVDYAAVMAYHDDPKKIIEKVEGHLSLAKKLNKKIAIGVETQDLITLNQGERRFTFFEEGWEHMERALQEVKNRFKDNPAFEGFAIHCFYSYNLLPMGRNVPIKPRTKRVYTVASLERKRPIAIDGYIDDWDLSKPYIVDKKENAVHGKYAWGGPMDLSMVSYSMWDEDNLYFLFDVTDNKIVQEKTGHDMWEGDHVEFWLDMDLETDYNEAINSDDDYQFGFSPGNFINLKPEVYVWVPGLDMDYSSQIEIAAQRSDKGYNIEVRLPVSVLYAFRTRVGVGPTQPVGLISQPLTRQVSRFEKGMRFGTSLDPSDCDDPACPQKVLLSSSVERMWGDPTTFGFLELE